MSLTDEQRQKLGSLIAKKRDLRNESVKVDNEIDAEILQLLGAPFIEEKLVPPETKSAVDESTKVGEYNPEKIPWVQAEGQKGVYQKYPAFKQKPAMLVDYINLLGDLKRHDGKLQRAGLFYWLFQDSVTIGRKPAKK